MAIGRQLKLYLWKNGLQKSRGYGQTCCEFTTPIVLVALFAWLYTEVTSTTFPDTTYECDMAVMDNARYDFVYLPRALNMTATKLGVVGPASVRAAFASHLSSFYPGLPQSSLDQLQCSIASMDSRINNVQNNSGFPSFDGYLVNFDSEAELESYVAQDHYGDDMSIPALVAAIVFARTGTPGQPGQWQYKIRTNASVIPDTHVMTDDLQRGVVVSNLQRYIGGNTTGWASGNPHTLNNRIPGFVPLQLAVDRFIMNTTFSDAPAFSSNSVNVTDRFTSIARGLKAAHVDVDGSIDAIADALPLDRHGREQARSTSAAASGSSGLGDWASSIDIAMFAATWNCSNTLDPNSGPAISNVAAFLRSHSLLPQRVRVAPFPMSSYTSDNFYSIVQSVFAFVFVMSFFFPSFFLIRGLVVEKETKIREGVRMMGMTDTALFAAWYCTYALMFGGIALLVALTVKLTFFSNSDMGIVFLFFWLFGLTATSLCFLLSVFFSRAKLASIVGALLFIATFFPYFQVNDPLKDSSVKTAASVCSPVAFGLALDLLAMLESNGQGVSWENINNTYNNYSFSTALLMMVADVLLYTFLGWYLTNVIPQEFGVAQPWYFPITKNYWIPDDYGEGGVVATIVQGVQKMLGGGSASSAVEQRSDRQSLLGPAAIEGWEPALGEAVEAPGPSLCELGRAGRSVCVRGLRKEFSTPDGTKVAVAGVDIDMFEGQIMALLGHNGAGKTTTISMLTGLIPPTAGEAQVYGRNMRTQMSAVRQQMGVCPQHDVLWPDLTVEEHLQFFAGLKGVEPSLVPGAVAQVIRDVGLLEKVRTLSKDLSGGMKRKLSVAIALIGGSKIVFLDEPTSGMDPYSRRSTWQTLQNAREGRVMVLTTHFMDEADLLGDRIAIMANGRVRCCGSSMFLKKLYGVGYNLTLVKNTTNGSCDEEAIAKTVAKHVPEATLLSNVGSEMAFQMPLGASQSFPLLFATLEQNAVPLGVLSYGVSVTTLEEVFLKVAEEGEPSADSSDASSHGSLTPKPSLTSSGSVGGMSRASSNPDIDELASKATAAATQLSAGAMFAKHFSALIRKRAQFAMRDKRAVMFNLLIPVAALSAGLALLHQVTMATWPAFSLGMQYFNGGMPPVPAYTPPPPSAASAVASATGMLVHPNYIAYSSSAATDSLMASLVMSGSGPFGNWPGLGAAQGSSLVPITNLDAQYPPQQYNGLSNTSDNDCWSLVYENGLPIAALGYADDLMALPEAFAMSRWLIDHKNGSEASGTSSVEGGASRYIAYSITGLNKTAGKSAYASYTALVNTSAFHIAPTAVAIINSGIFNWLFPGANGDSSISVVNEPLPFTARETLVVTSITSFISVLFVVIAFAFIPASFAMFVVKERETGAKHQQLISGVSIPAYWAATYAWDLCNYALPCVAALILIAAFDIKEFLGSSLGATAMLFITYGTSVAPFTYCLSYLFQSHSTAQTMTLVINLLCLVLLLASYVMHLIPSTCDADASLRFVFRLVPGFSLGVGLMQLSVLPELPFLENDCGRMPELQMIQQKFTAWSLPASGYSILYMTIGSIVYFSLAILIDIGLSYPWLRAWLMPDKNVPEGNPDDDSDVIAEADRVAAGRTGGDIVVVDHLRKVYGGGKTAVRNLSFGLPPGECFGFLGINGAGKTTTMKILTGDIIPTRGTARLANFDILSQQTEVRRLVGYCPQFDALLELLTVREHLQLYARIKGVPEDRLPQVVESKIVELDLSQYANKLAGSLSGGNKRKLSVAISMIGDPLLLFLDEPSTGMDPVARRFMWRVIARIASEHKRCSIMLTTHSMEEAEALCTRIGIMVGGRLRCLGSTQHLKSKFGQGYLAVFKLSPPTPEHVAKALQMLRPHLQPPDVEADARGADAPLGSWRLHARDVMPACAALGDEARARMLHPSSTGWGIANSLKAEASVEAAQFADWWASESLGASLHQFVIQNFGGSELMERHGEFFRYKLPAFGSASSTRLSSVFDLIEKSKDRLRVAEYSLSQVSLESIFNAMAAQQEEERGVARGMAAGKTDGDKDGSSSSSKANVSPRDALEAARTKSFSAHEVVSIRGINNPAASSSSSSGPGTPPRSISSSMWTAFRKAGVGALQSPLSSPGIMMDSMTGSGGGGVGVPGKKTQSRTAFDGQGAYTSLN